ncbi:MAG: response regulator [Lachnospiraceae bacterium]|nr:response regulator [Lachnospiraceae bacterium]
MIQKTCFVKNIAQLKETVNNIKRLEAFGKASSVVGLIYVNGFNANQTQEYLDILKREMPSVIFAGSTVINSSHDWLEKGISLSFLIFESSKADLYVYKTGEQIKEEIVKKFVERINQTPNTRVVLSYPSDLGGDFSLALDEVMDKLKEDVTFFGGHAGSSYYLSENLDFSNATVHIQKNLKEDTDNLINLFNRSVVDKEVISFSIGNEIIESGYVFVALSGEKLHEMAKYVLGWKSLGKAIRVTARGEEDESRNICVKGLDGVPAADIYKKYLDVDVDEYFLDNVCEFPLVLKRGETVMARVPNYAGREKELYFAGDIRDEDELHLSYAVPGELFKACQKAADDMASFENQAILMSVCFNRFYFLRERQKLEIKMFEKSNPNTLFGFGGYEILKNKGCGGILNSALVALALREGEGGKTKSEVEVNVEKAQTKRKPLPERLINFIDTSTKELEEAYKAAESANESKSSFLSHMSHEIRTPINAVLGMDEMILRESKDKNVLDYAQNIKNAGNNLLRIVNDILDFSKIEAGKMEIIPVEYELASLLNDLVNMVSTRAKDKGLEIEINVDSTIPHVLYGDEIRIKQVVTNILTNAVKYTNEGKVSLSVRWKSCEIEADDRLLKEACKQYAGKEKCQKQKNIRLEFEVKDTGVGMKKEDLPKLFKSFERIDEIHNRTVEGTGLGMAITQDLLHLMGSELKVESEFGKGSTFSFEILQKMVDDTPIGDFNEALKKSLFKHNKTRESFVAENAKILLVDDTLINLTVIQNLLKHTKMQIDTATSGKECIEKALQKKYDIILMDHRMPEMDGIECLQILKEDEGGFNQNTPSIALTANAVSGSREMYLDAGFDNYLSKPVDAELLEKMIMKYLPENSYKTITLTSEVTQENEPDESFETNTFLNPKEGIANCGDEASYDKALKTYLEDSDSLYKTILNSYENGDIENYTIKVHALKSSSKIIGANMISELAKELEDAGNEGNTAFIKKHTDELLTYYKSLIYMLKNRFANDESDDSKPEIEESSLKEAFDTIKELADMFDYDSVAAVMESLEEYKIPGMYEDKVKALKSAISNADWDEIKKVLN